MHEYHQINGCFPPEYLTDRNGQPAGDFGAWCCCNFRMILSTTNAASTSDGTVPTTARFTPGLAIGMSGVYPAYHCPSDADSDRLDTSYVMVVGKGTISAGPNSVRMEDITDGTSHTIGLAEMAESGIPWIEPRDLKFDDMSFKINDFPNKCIRSRHPGIANVMMMDVSVHSLKEDIDPKVLKACSPSPAVSLIPN